MIQYDNCQHCFEPKRGNAVCPHCGFDSSTIKKYGGVLSPFTVLNGRYLVGRVLGKGGFGVTYIAKDLNYNRICAIKEYLPAEYSSRNNGTKNITPFSDAKAQYVFNHGREKFVEEARTLIALRNNPIVVDIWDFFQENNTAYLVMECLDGQDLRKMAKMQGGKLDPEFAKTVFVTVASSLMEIHRLNILHRDLSPENIIVTKDGRIKLIDFGAARNFVSTQNAGMSILLKPGFAPPEQYERKGVQGPWSDVYALCATYYNLVSGKPLVDALFRYRGQDQPSLVAMGCPVSKKTSDVIDKGMELDYKRRYQDFKVLLNDIDITVSSRTNQGEKHVSISTQNTESKTVITPIRTGGTSQKIATNSVSDQGNERVMTSQKHAYIAAVMKNGLFNKVTIPKGDAFTVGRSAQCHYTIAGDSNVSREHVRVRFDGYNLYLMDKSANGTFFSDGRRLEKNKEYQVASETQFYVATQNHMLIVGIE